MLKSSSRSWDICIYVLTFWSCRKYVLIRKLIGQILPNISRSKDNHTMKFGQLVEYNMIFFLKNHTQNVEEKLVPDPFIKIKIEHISGSTTWNVIKFVFIVCWDLPKYIKTIVLTSCFHHNLYKAFEKTKKRSWTSLPTSFFRWFLKKNISHAIFY